MVKFPVLKIQKGVKKRRPKLGKITRNPFFNFLRYFRKASRGLPMSQVTKNAAIHWRGMSARDRSPYQNMARKAPAKRKSLKKPSARKRGTKKRKKQQAKHGKRCSRRNF